MSNSYKVVATPAFKLCLRKLMAFLERKYSAEVAKNAKQSIRSAIENKISQHPNSSPISERLSGVGITDYRQAVIDEHNLLFYRVDEPGKKIILIAVIDARQSIEKLLFDLTILS